VKRVLRLLLALSACAAIPASAGTITDISIQTNPTVTAPQSGTWNTYSSNWASIGVSEPGASNNPFLDPSPTGAMSVDSGSYLLFLGYEDRFDYGAVLPGAITLDLAVYYSDSSELIATFTNNDLASPSIWTRNSGSTQLVIGSSGITNVDRNGDYASGTYGANGANDVVLEFSDTGRFDSENESPVPEPWTNALLASGLSLLFLMKRWHAGRPQQD